LISRLISQKELCFQSIKQFSVIQKSDGLLGSDNIKYPLDNFNFQKVMHGRVILKDLVPICVQRSNQKNHIQTLTIVAYATTTTILRVFV